MLCACIFLGFKIAQLNVNLDIMINICPFLTRRHHETQVENVIIMYEYEFYLINVINYDFYVYNPYKAKIGLIYDIKTSDKEGITDIVNLFSLKDFENKVDRFIDKTFYSDIMFLFNYSHIALSCIFMAAETCGIDTDRIRYILDLDSFMKYDHFINAILPIIKNEINNITIIKPEEFQDKMKKILRFLKDNPKYMDKIEADRKYK